MGFARSHDHSHGHADHVHAGRHVGGNGHAHSHAPTDFGPAFAIGVALNTAFVVIEAAAGYLTDSMALIADAGHNLSDVLALLLAWGAAEAAKRPPRGRFTYGFKSSTILAAIANALLLAIAIGAILIETTHRLLDPGEPQGTVMVAVAGIGVAINALTALLFMRGQEDLNIKGAYLHMAADALVSLGVVIAGLAIVWTGIALLDPLTSLAILAVIAWGTWGLARDSVKLGLLAAPERIDVEEVRAHLGALDGVEAVHDLHIWPMSTTETALTAHLVMPGEAGSDDFLREAARSLRQHFGIGHSTIQVERVEAAACEHPC
ncbi:MAG: cation diffusion facilitator family transporter [Erythrobacter sp.]|uniref:cation diffusion facilitator family transporter n=1 Tax=Erythrobacter sp. TaxID=1042 RepID=UPI0032EE4B65